MRRLLVGWAFVLACAFDPPCSPPSSTVDAGAPSCPLSLEGFATVACEGRPSCSACRWYQEVGNPVTVSNCIDQAGRLCVDTDYMGEPDCSTCRR